MNSRLRELRRTLGLRQVDFAKRINIGTSSLAMFETGNRAMKDIHISQICNIFNVNESWLRTGSGEMFNQTDDTILSAVAEKYHLDRIERSIVETFLTMEPQTRESAKAFLLKMGEAAARGKVAE
ncbi:MAG: helix-turn-helix transcriptional regulator [Christensenellaceae bacterium]|nr:helix-turn-helix transcriptional regulator [Christensenellaceae bacterium]